MNRSLLRSTWALPIVIALLSTAGLISALVGDGLPDVIAWVALAAPLLAVGWAMRTKDKRPERTRTAPRTGAKGSVS